MRLICRRRHVGNIFEIYAVGRHMVSYFKKCTMCYLFRYRLVKNDRKVYILYLKDKAGWSKRINNLERIVSFSYLYIYIFFKSDRLHSQICTLKICSSCRNFIQIRFQHWSSIASDKNKFNIIMTYSFLFFLSFDMPFSICPLLFS